MKKLTLKNIQSYLVGYTRYYIYYSRYKKFIRKHILEQINYRIAVMNKECYNNGSCIKCGCQTTALQMCKKACLGNCYPKMMNRKDWIIFKNTNDMDIWENKDIDLGTLKPGEKVTITFKRTHAEHEIESFESSCGCSTPIYDKDKDEITVKYTVGDIPRHLKDVGVSKTTKIITVNYKGRSSDYLTFRATIKK